MGKTKPKPAGSVCIDSERTPPSEPDGDFCCRARGLRADIAAAPCRTGVARSQAREYVRGGWTGFLVRQLSRRAATASGEPFDPDAMTAAHRTLPLGTVVRVTNMANGRIVTVRINDRGPHDRSRIIDLSRGAAQALGFVSDGVMKVKIERPAPD